MIRKRHLKANYLRTLEENGERITDDSAWTPNAEKIRQVLNGGRIEQATLLYDFDGSKRLTLENDITRIEGITPAEIHQYKLQIQEEYSEAKRNLNERIKELKEKEQAEMNKKLKEQIEAEVQKRLAEGKK